jgi:D-mannonate dehydratase
MMENRFYEEFKVRGKDLVEKIKALIHEGNVRRIILKDDKGQTFMEIPLTVAALSVIAAPVLAAVGALAAMVAHFNVVVERAGEPPSPPPAQ